jgi:hypothetical protein
VFDSYVKDFDVDGDHIELALWDTAGKANTELKGDGHCHVHLTLFSE